MEINTATILLILAIAIVPVIIIFATLRIFRKNRETKAERGKSLEKKFKDVKEERMEDQQGSKMA